MRRLAFLLAFAGCAYIEPYEGPPGPPVLSEIEHTTIDFDSPRVLRKTFLIGVTNASAEPIERILDCDPDATHVSKFRFNHGMGSRTHVKVPPMSTLYVLTDYSDKLCSLLPVD